ncbi:reverse transcriptase domain-containing protein [Tanacetum coccineum]
MTAPILVTPDWDLPFEIMYDASDFAVGAVLGQRKTKHFQPIHYASKTMTDAQAHYTTMEKELLAVVYAFEKFRPYLVLSKTRLLEFEALDPWFCPYLLQAFTSSASYGNPISKSYRLTFIFSTLNKRL